MKECELCDSPARMYCESDQASLCWDCDAKVHCANFLVARHTRSLLCHSCQSPTPWKASGSKLGPTISICDICVNRCSGTQEKNEQEENDDESQGPDDDDEDDELDEEGENDENHEDDEDEEEGENQVVPWSSTPTPPITSSSSSESSSRLCNGGGVTKNSTASLKRMRDQNIDLCSQDDLGCSNYNPNLRLSVVNRTANDEEEEEATSSFSFRPVKDRKLALTIQSSSSPSVDSKSSATILSSLKRFERKILTGNNTSEAILSLSKLSKDPRAS